jgi:hypothetical protein
MNNKSVRTVVLNAILEKGVIDNGNVVGTLTDKAKIGGISGRDKVLGALDTLERSGSIGVTRRGKQIVKVFPIPKETCERSDRADRSPAAKRESMFAKGVPAYLPDQLCTPVVVIKKEDRDLVVTPNDMPTKIQSISEADEKSTTNAQPAEVTVSTKHTLLDDVNLAYTGLRCRANPETGVLPVGSVHAFIMEDLKCSANRATYINQTLAKLGLRSTVNLGFGPKSEGLQRVSGHQSTVDVTVDLITQEMLDALKASSELVEKVDEVPEPALASVAPNEPVAPPEDVVEKLVEIIKGLEEQNRLLEQAKREEVEGLRNDLRAAQEQISALTRQAAVAPEVASILEKYDKL